MCRSWQDCCRRGENRSWPYVSGESVDSECWVLNNAIFYAFIMRLTVQERVFILESYLKTMSYAHCRESSLKNLEGNPRDLKQLKMNITRAIEEVNERTLRKVMRNMVKRVDKCTEMNGHHFQNFIYIYIYIYICVCVCVYYLVILHSFYYYRCPT